VRLETEASRPRPHPCSYVFRILDADIPAGEVLHLRPLRPASVFLLYFVTIEATSTFRQFVLFICFLRVLLTFCD